MRPACYNAGMENKNPTTHLQQAIDNLPPHMSMQDFNDPTLLSRLEQQLAAYHIQSMAIYLRNFVRDLPAPGHGFELSVDTEDGTYYLYCGGESGIEVDADHFEDDQALAEYCRQQSSALEGFAQELNDSPWRPMRELRVLVERLNEVCWERDEIDDAIAQALDDAGHQGHAFMASLAAGEIEQATPQAHASHARRPGL